MLQPRGIICGARRVGTGKIMLCRAYGWVRATASYAPTPLQRSWAALYHHFKAAAGRRPSALTKRRARVTG